ncbi:MAG: hypothetical protein ACT4OJ_07955 [Bacteroidota bacterium]
MKKILMAAAIIACMAFLAGGCASTNTTSSAGGLGKLSQNDMKEFSHNVHKVYIWTHIAGDSRYNYHKDALTAINQKLQRLGYESEAVWYNPRKEGATDSDWLRSIINSLGSDKALLEIVTNHSSYEVSKTIPTETTKYVVRDSYGRPVSSVNEKGYATRTKTKGTAHVQITLYYTSPTRGAVKYNVDRKINRDNLSLAVDYVTSTIPKKRLGK